MEELYDGTARRRAFRAGGRSRQHHLRAAGRNAVMFVLCRRRCEYGPRALHTAAIAAAREHDRPRHSQLTAGR